MDRLVQGLANHICKQPTTKGLHSYVACRPQNNGYDCSINVLLFLMCILKGSGRHRLWTVSTRVVDMEGSSRNMG